MNVQTFSECGKNDHKCEFTDEEVCNQIEVLRCIIAYFEGRADAGILLLGLRCNLDIFESFARQRDL